MSIARWILFAALSITATAQVTAITQITVIHPEREGAAAIEKNRTVVVNGDRIQAIGAAGTVDIPAEARMLVGTGKFLIPGLIDSHVHFFQSGNPYTRPDAVDLTKLVPYAKEVARNKERLPATFKVWLACGVTGVADVGGPFWNFDVRNAARTSPAAPRVVVAGPLISMIDRPQLDLGDPPIIKVTSPDAARSLVSRELARKPDFIKVWFIHMPKDDLAAQEAIVKATADAAHAFNVRLAVHATELETAKAALRAGADLLVHSVMDKPVDEEFLALARKNHALYTPTLFVGMGYQLEFSGAWKPTEAELRLADPEILKSMDDIGKLTDEQLPRTVAQLRAMKLPVPKPAVAMKNLRTVWDAGITVVMGTDAGNIGTLHGPSIFREMDLMAEAGLTPLQVLRSATVNGAKTLGIADLGTIAPGKLSDLVILNADPLTDVKNLSNIYRVMKSGVMYDPTELVTSIR
jgi:imidazolonepropionase-like amidohydrolase